MTADTVLRPRVRERPLVRLDRRIARWLNARQFAALAGRPIDHRGSRLVRIALLAVSVPLLAVAPGCLAFGVYLMFAGPGFTPFLGLLLVLFAVVIRPRLPRPPQDGWVLTPTDTPAFFALVERVAAATGTPVPATVMLTARMGASAGVVGLRRRVLAVGLPLWAALPPQQRIAVLAHELGHFVNHDARRSRLVRPAFVALDNLVGTLRVAAWNGGFFVGIPLFLASLPFAVTRLVLVLVDFRDHQRAEYLADDLSARIAGSHAAAAMLDALRTADRVPAALDAARGNHADPAGWRTAADQAARAAGDVEDRPSLFSSHPPTGLRAGMVRSRPHHSASVVLTEAEADRIDTELAPWYARLRRRALDG